MKTKYLFMMLFCASLFLFSSCTKDDEDSLRGSLWALYDPASNWGPEHTQYIEFTDGTNVKSWDSYYGKETHGTYTLEGDKIKFHNFIYSEDVYVEATYTSKSLTVFYYMNGWTDHLYKEIFTRQ